MCDPKGFKVTAQMVCISSIHSSLLTFTSVYSPKGSDFCFHLHGPALMSHWAMASEDLLGVGAKAWTSALFSCHLTVNMG